MNKKVLRKLLSTRTKVLQESDIKISTLKTRIEELEKGDGSVCACDNCKNWKELELPFCGNCGRNVKQD